MTLFEKFMPSTALMVLLVIGFVDLVITAVLHANGLIVELNPLMKPIIETSEWLFAIVKGSTLVLAYMVMMRFWDTHKAFVNKACWLGSGAYVIIWCIWFFSAL